MTEKPSRTSGETILEAIQDLENHGRKADRPMLRDITGLKMSIVDDHVARLVEAGKVRRLGKGVLELVHQFPESRPISKTVMANGLVKLEIDNVYLELTPHESRVLGALFAGDAAELSRIREDQDLTDTVQALNNRVKVQQRMMDEMANSLARLKRRAQGDLFGKSVAA